MASKSICTSCLRTLRQQAPPRTQRLASINRSFTTAPPRRRNEQSTTTTTTPPPPPPPSSSNPIPQPSSTSPNLASNLASTLRHNPALKSTTEPYIAYGSTETLFLACQSQCSYTIPSVLATPPAPAPKNAGGEDVGVGEGWWMTPKSTTTSSTSQGIEGGLGLEPTFNTWAQIVMLHMYLLTLRLRQFPPQHAPIWHQNLLDHFFYAAEDRMAVWHGMSARGVRNKYLKDLWLQWRGLQLSYDEGLIKGDAVMAGAVWRNLFRGREETDVGDLGVVVAYMRREMGRLAEVTDEQVGEGAVKFGDPRAVVGSVQRESPWVRRALEQEDLRPAVLEAGR
ncbi:Serine carboxypeptidase 3 [Recurvomyces mirabilis]|nr:Serine carboxypeptidase 3 [Recurvomyces mirabilis]